MQDAKKVKREAGYLPLRDMILRAYQLSMDSTVVALLVEETVLSENWNALSLERKTDRIMFQCLIEVEPLNLEKSLQRIAINKRNILRLLLFHKDREVVRYWEGLFYHERQHISVESLSITIFWQKVIDKLFSANLTNVPIQEIYFLIEEKPHKKFFKIMVFL